MKPQRPMNSASPTKKATPTSKKEGDQPIVEAAAKLLANDNSGGWMRSILSAVPLRLGCLTLEGPSSSAEAGV